MRNVGLIVCGIAAFAVNVWCGVQLGRCLGVPTVFAPKIWLARALGLVDTSQDHQSPQTAQRFGIGWIVSGVVVAAMALALAMERK